MEQIQLPLFRRKMFPVVLTQGLPIVAPAADSSVLSTLRAYFAYLQSQGYLPYDLFSHTISLLHLLVHPEDSLLSAYPNRGDTTEAVELWSRRRLFKHKHASPFETFDARATNVRVLTRVHTTVHRFALRRSRSAYWTAELLSI